MNRLPATNTPSKLTFWSSTGEAGQRQPDNYQGLKAGSLDNVRVGRRSITSIIGGGSDCDVPRTTAA